MSDHSLNVSRRAVVQALGATGLASALPWAEALAKKQQSICKLRLRKIYLIPR